MRRPWCLYSVRGDWIRAWIHAWIHAWIREVNSTGTSGQDFANSAKSWPRPRLKPGPTKTEARATEPGTEQVAEKRAKGIPQALKRIGSQALNVGAKAPTPENQNFSATCEARPLVCCVLRETCWEASCSRGEAGLRRPRLDGVTRLHASQRSARHSTNCTNLWL